MTDVLSVQPASGGAGLCFTYAGTKKMEENIMSKRGLILLVLVAVVLVGYFVFKDQIIDFVRNIQVQINSSQSSLIDGLMSAQ